MPIILNTYETSYRLAIWETTEPLEYFENKAHFTPYDIATYDKISNVSRKKEWLAVRVLLFETLGFWPQISYTEAGKPLLQNHARHLSISHSKDMVGILLCISPYAGIDIERTTRNIETVSPRFLSEKELNDIKEKNTKNSEITYWCAKEAIFKAVNEQNISFSKQILIENIASDGSMDGQFISTQEEIKFKLHSIEIQNNLIVWTTESHHK